MTRTYVKKLMAITLCIVLVLSTLCTFACVTDKNHKNTQFFAVDFSRHNSGGSSQSLSGDTESRIITWIRNPEITTENQITSPAVQNNISFYADKLFCLEKLQGEDLYSKFKKTEYFLRI